MMRERPHLVFAADGNTPLALTTGAAPGPATCEHGPCPQNLNDYSFTLLQKIRQTPGEPIIRSDGVHGCLGRR